MPSSRLEPTVRHTYAWYVVGVLTLAYVTSFVDRQILFLMVGPIKRDLGVSDTRMGLLMGLSFALFYAFLGFPIGRLADSKSRRAIIGLGMAVWSVFTTLSGVARSYWHLFLARIGVGVGEAALSPAAYSLIADYFPKERLGTAIGVYSLGIYLGSGIALALGGWIVGLVAGSAPHHLPLVGEVRAWQLVFFLVGAPGLLLALLIATVREPFRTGGAATAVPLDRVLGWVLSHRRAFLSHNVGYALIAMVNYGWAAWVPTFLQRTHGWSVTRAGVVYGSWTMTLGVAGVVVGGWLGDVLLRRGYPDAKLRVGILAAAGELLSTFLYLFAPTGWMVLALAPSTFFASFGFGAAPAGIQEITPPPMRAQTSALYIFIVNLIGLGLGPLAVGRLTDAVFHDEAAIRYSLLIVSVAGLVVAAGVFLSGLRAFRAAAASVESWNGGER